MCRGRDSLDCAASDAAPTANAVAAVPALSPWPLPRRPDRSTILERARIARENLRACALCEFRCGVDRTRPAEERAHTPCGLGVESRTFKRHISFAEELELLPSYMVYLGGCNFRCRFCVQGPTCFSPATGELVDPAALAHESEAIVARGARTINLLGGEPSLHLHTVLELAAEAELPIAFNSNMYMTEEALDLLDGLVAIYVADLKFGSDRCADQVARAPRYLEVVRRNLLRAAAQAPLIVRHLLMPGHLECCLRPTAEWVAEHLPQATFNVMSSYVPAWQAARDTGPLGGLLSRSEIEAAETLVRSLGLRRESLP